MEREGERGVYEQGKKYLKRGKKEQFERRILKVIGQRERKDHWERSRGERDRYDEGKMGIFMFILAC